jgi:hypothetical protein
MSSRRTRGSSRGTTKPSPKQQDAVDDAFRNIVAIVEAARTAGGTQSRSSLKQARPQHGNGATTEIPDLSAVIGDATSEDSQLKALAASLNGMLRFPVDGFVVGEPVEVMTIDYDGNVRRGIAAACRRREGLHTVSLADVSFSPGPAASAVALYRQWLGLPTEVETRPSAASSSRRHKVEQDEIELGQPLDLVVLACKSNALRCRLLGTERELTLRTAVRDEVPGEVITVVPAKSWTHARHPYLSGAVEASRLDVQALGLPPLELRAEGDWDPDEEYWGEEGEPIEEWAKPIIARGKRPAFEMEQVIPGADPEDFDSDAILEASDLRAAGYHIEAYELLMRLLAADLRCLDAHSHLGNWEFDHRPKQALRHYAVGVGIGALTLGTDFDGVLPWGLIDNRPFLRCMHGLGISFWKLGHTREAAGVFRRMLWLNPSDNQGARFNLAAVEDGRTWEEMEEADA